MPTLMPSFLPDDAQNTPNGVLKKTDTQKSRGEEEKFVKAFNDAVNEAETTPLQKLIVAERLKAIGGINGSGTLMVAAIAMANGSKKQKEVLSSALSTIPFKERERIKREINAEIKRKDLNRSGISR